MPRLDPSVVGDFLYDGSDSANLYLGWAAVNTSPSTAAWRIAKINISGTSVSIKYAQGSPEYSFVWNNRSTYTYS